MFAPILVLGIVGIGSFFVKAGIEEMEKEEERKNTPFIFGEDLSQSGFEEIVRKTAKQIKRLQIENIDGPVIEAIVLSQSGISTWKFTLDFNDWGKLTGTYYLLRDNYDSKIPESFAERVADEIKKKLNSES